MCLTLRKQMGAVALNAGNISLLVYEVSVVSKERTDWRYIIHSLSVWRSVCLPVSLYACMSVAGILNIVLLTSELF